MLADSQVLCHNIEDMTQNLRDALEVKYGESRNPEGRPSSWQHGKTQTIRVPVALSNQVMEYARNLDSGDVQDMSQSMNEHIYSAIKLLEEGLTLKANAGGAIKDRIRAALELLKQSPE